MSFFGSLLDGGVLLLCEGVAEEGGDADLSDDDDDDDGAGEDGDDGAIADEEDEGDGVLEDVDDGGGVDVDVVDDSRWQPAAPNTSAMPSTSESLRFNIGRTSHLG